MELVDLHTHSCYSDGSLMPSDLVALAKKQGVQILSLTDHDEIAGLALMKEATEKAGIKFIPGVEITANWGSRSIHVVGLNFDQENTFLIEFLEKIRSDRKLRAQKMASILSNLGMPGAWEGLESAVTNPNLISRKHFADWMIAQGFVKTHQEAFDKWLGDQCPAYVPCTQNKIKETVQVILQAGGVPVLAHPGRYKLEEWALQELLDEFKNSGGIAIEVCSGSHNASDVSKFTKIALEEGFEASTGSDFHSRASKFMPGCQLSLPETLVPVWHRF